MNQVSSGDRIVEYLRIKPISHGQIHTFQIAIPESEIVEITSEKCEQLKISLTQQGTNLVPLIVRRTEAYSEEEEYEVVYGADWCLVAKELDIEKLWVWVFDMTDEQAAAAKEEMQQLLGFSESNSIVLPASSEETESTKMILKQLDKLSRELVTLNHKLEQVSLSVKKLELSESQQIATANDNKLVQLITESIKEVIKETVTNQQEQTKKDYERMTRSQLDVIALDRNIKGRSKMNKSELIAAIKKAKDQ